MVKETFSKVVSFADVKLNTETTTLANVYVKLRAEMQS